MAEIICRYPLRERGGLADGSVRWLDVSELDVFNRHLALCSQRPLDAATWNCAYAEGTVYCGRFAGDTMVARVCMEKYAEDRWEVADVRTVRKYRGRGCATAVCDDVLRCILAQNRIPTMRTEADNAAMRRVIVKLRFVPMDGAQCEG